MAKRRSRSDSVPMRILVPNADEVRAKAIYWGKVKQEQRRIASDPDNWHLDAFDRPYLTHPTTEQTITGFARLARALEDKCRLCNRLSSFGRRPGQKQHNNVCSLCEAWLLYVKRGRYKPEVGHGNTMVQPYYAERARAAWSWLQRRIPAHGLDLNVQEVNQRLVCKFRLVDLFRFYADLGEQKRIYFTAGKVAKVHLVAAQQRAKQQPIGAKIRATRRKKKRSSD